MFKIISNRYLKSMAFGLFAFCLFCVLSCDKKKPPLPTVAFAAVVSDKTVSFTVESTDASSLAWDYGDGTKGTDKGNHTHTYLNKGTYTISVVASNSTGTASASRTLDVAIPIMELLAGTATGGKTWLLDKDKATLASKIATDLEAQPWIPVPSNALGFDTKADLSAEYDNEYTFKPDGSFDIKGVNGKMLTGLLFANVTTLQISVGSEQLGLAQVTKADVTGAAYTLKEKQNLSLDVANEQYPKGEVVAEGPGTVAFKEINYITFDGAKGGFLGFLDFTTTVIIREINSSSMKVTMFLSTLNPTKNKVNEANFMRPSIAVTVYFKVKK